MKKNNETLQIGDLLSKTIFAENKNDKMSCVMKHSTIFSFWNNIVGQKFAKFSKPLSIKGTKLFVSVKSPVVAQELSLNKIKLIKNINTYSMPLGIEIKDIILDYKNFFASNPIEETKGVEDKPVLISDDKINDIDIDENLKKDIENNIGKIKFLNSEQKEKFSKKIINVYKAKKFQD